MSHYLVESHLKQKVHERGKRIGADAVSVLDAFIDQAIESAARTHNGGRQTIDGTVMRMALSGAAKKSI